MPSLTGTTTSEALIDTLRTRPWKGRDQLLALVAPLVLVAVATTQMIVAANSDLTPWRGGGFGMFSTVDTHDLRQVRAAITTAGGQDFSVDLEGLVEVGLPWSDLFVAARANPSPRNLDALGRALAEEPSVLSTAAIPGFADEDAQSDLRPTMTETPSRLHVEVWRVRFERSTDTLVPELIVAHRIRP